MGGRANGEGRETEVEGEVGDGRGERNQTFLPEMSLFYLYIRG